MKASFLGRAASLCIALLLVESVVIADDTVDLGGVDDIEELTLAELLGMEVSVATRGSGRRLRDTPGIVTVYSREELQRLGVRDLSDVLMLVPGFSLGTDVFNTVYPIVRGAWAAEGKVLVLLDGHELYDLAYFTTPLGNRFPIDWLDRIEIIRGPGSVLYGGVAELAVINIVPRQGKANAANFDAAYGQMMGDLVSGDDSFGESYARRTVSAHYAQHFEEHELDVRAGVFGGQAQRSDRDYVDVYGDRFDQAGSSGTNPLTVNLAAHWKGLSISALYERYGVEQRDGYDAVLHKPLTSYFATAALRLAYAYEPTEELTITPELRYQYQTPWKSMDAGCEQYSGVCFDIEAQRLVGGLSASWKPLEMLDILVGGEATHDSSSTRIPGFDDPNPATEELTFLSGAGYAQALVQTLVGEFSLGARYDYHEQFGDAFVPRIAYTKTLEEFHVKLLASRAFRAPSMRNLSISPELSPEMTTAYEVESGIQFTDSVNLTVNGFVNIIKDPIIYGYDTVTFEEGYQNASDLTARGFEAEIRYRRGDIFGSLSYSVYDAMDRPPPYRVPGHRSQLLGAPTHKFVFQGAFEVLEGLSLGGSATFSSERYAMNTTDTSGWELRGESFDSELLVNAYLRYDLPNVEGLYTSLGGYNLLNERTIYASTYYDSWHAPLPGPSLEVLLKVGYELGL